MNKKKLAILLFGVLLLAYSGIAYYFTRGLRIFTISITTGNILTISLPYAFCIGLMVFLAGMVFLVKWNKALKISKTKTTENTVVTDIQPETDSEIQIKSEKSEETEIEEIQAEIPVAEATVCNDCGEPAKKGAKFCTKCGKSLIVGEKL